MKKIILLLSLTFFSITCFGQKKVKDKGKWSVLHNMEFMNRVKLQPEWYHYAIWYKKIFGVKVPMVGLGLHRHYAKQDKRLVKQEAPMVAAVYMNKEQTEKEHADAETVYMQELAKFADKSLDYQYILTKSRREELEKKILDNLSAYSSNGGETRFSDIFYKELARIQQNTKIIHDSHLSNAKKREAYLGIEKELIKVNSLVSRLINLNKIKLQ